MSVAVGDTIAAIATARGVSALAVVRLSGPRAIEILDSCWRGFDGRLADAATRTVHVGILSAPDGESIDQVVVTLFRAPASPTGEDVVEISCHGGAVVPGRILDRLLQEGARAAGPGEFTQRAFIHGKIDLAQAEAVADVIHAQATRAQRSAQKQLNGRFSALLGRLREELIGFCGLIELELDFSDTDQTFADLQRLRGILKQVQETVSALLDHGRSGDLLREGVRVVIAGLPNAGKSTLLNALVGHERVIVSEHPGTTRDLVEVDLEVDGILFRLVDTAGLRDTDDTVESEGVRRARRALEGADVVVYVFDGTTKLLPEESSLLKELEAGIPRIVVANKSDLIVGTDTQTGSVISFSARSACNDPNELSPLLNALVAAVVPMVRDADDSPALLNTRHRAHLRAAGEALGRVEAGLDAQVTGDLLAVDLRLALHELGSITGEITSEDVLDTVFARFCIGK